MREENKSEPFVCHEKNTKAAVRAGGLSIGVAMATQLQRSWFSDSEVGVEEGLEEGFS